MSLDLTLIRKRVVGTAILDVLAAPGAEEIVLDSQGLQIGQVTDEDGAPLAFTLGEAVEGKGTPLSIAVVPAEEPGRRRIAIAYTALEAEALQWLAPEQTAGGQHPYLLSQGQPTLNRSWIPTQDSPGIRQTWEAASSRRPLPSSCPACASASPKSSKRSRASVSRWTCRSRVLIAIAAGYLAFRDLGPRSGVWTEPSMSRPPGRLGDTER